MLAPIAIIDLRANIYYTFITVLVVQHFYIYMIQKNIAHIFFSLQDICKINAPPQGPRMYSLCLDGLLWGVYSYRGLATAEASKGSKVMTASSGQEVDVDSTKRVIEPDWTVGLDEEATELCHVPSAGKDVPGSVVVLCRRSLHILQDVGVLQFSRKVDFSAYSLLAYRNCKSWNPPGSQNPPSICHALGTSDIGQEAVVSLVSTDSDTLYLFRNSTMQWATQVPFAPVAIQRASFYVSKAAGKKKYGSLFWCLIHFRSLLDFCSGGIHKLRSQAGKPDAQFLGDNVQSRRHLCR